jgi:hypothetical protein
MIVMRRAGSLPALIMRCKLVVGMVMHRAVSVDMNVGLYLLRRRDLAGDLIEAISRYGAIREGKGQGWHEHADEIDKRSRCRKAASNPAERHPKHQLIVPVQCT